MKGVLVIDNGTYECRGGKEGKPPEVVVKNQAIRVKEKSGKIRYTIEGSKCAKIHPSSTVSVKTMFDGPVVYNYEVFEGVVRSVREEVGKGPFESIVLTECFLNPRMFKIQSLSVLFEQLRFKKVQLGYDFVYAYEYNMKNNEEMEKQCIRRGGDHVEGQAGAEEEGGAGEAEEKSGRPWCDVIISMGHQGVHVVPVDPERRKVLRGQAFFLPVGGLLLQSMFLNSVVFKYAGTGIKVPKEEVEPLFRKIRVAEEYFGEIEEVVHRGKGNVYVPDKTVQKERAPKVYGFNRRKAKPESAEADVEEPESAKRAKRDEDGVRAEDDEDGARVDDEDDVRVDDDDGVRVDEESTKIEEELNETQEEEIKKLKREKLIKGATEHRNKQKIAKILQRLSFHIYTLEQRHLLLTDPARYMEIRKSRLETLEKTLRRRNFVRNELKNKKSPHSLALLKQTLSSNQTEAPETSAYLQEIEESQLSDREIFEEIEYIDAFLRENDKTYVPKEKNPFDKIRDGYGKEKDGINVNIELVRTPEALFYPLIAGIDNPGITEALSEIFQTQDVRNVFVTGGFSQIQGLKKRLEKEIEPLRYAPNTPKVVFALDPVMDAFRGAAISSEFFPTYTLDEWSTRREEILKDEEA